MKPIDPSELLSNAEYLRRRPEIVRDIIALKSVRRVEIGPWVSAAFENRRTALYQIQEMLRIEDIAAPDAVRHEIETYSDLLPGEGELSITLFIEIPDAAQRREALAKLIGIERAVFLRLDGRRIPAFDKRPIDPRFAREQATAVYYLGFRLPEEDRKAFDSKDAWLDVDHPAYRHSAALPFETKESLAKDLLESAR